MKSKLKTILFTLQVFMKNKRRQICAFAIFSILVIVAAPVRAEHLTDRNVIFSEFKGHIQFRELQPGHGSNSYPVPSTEKITFWDPGYIDRFRPGTVVTDLNDSTVNLNNIQLAECSGSTPSLAGAGSCGGPNLCVFARVIRPNRASPYIECTPRHLRAETVYRLMARGVTGNGTVDNNAVTGMSMWEPGRDGSPNSEILQTFFKTRAWTPPTDYLFDFGDAGVGFPTLRSENGPRHDVSGRVWLGNDVDAESMALRFNLDDADGDDEDGMISDSPLVVRVSSGNMTGPAYINAWEDWNNNGRWDINADGSPGDEWIVRNQRVDVRPNARQDVALLQPRVDANGNPLRAAWSDPSFQLRLTVTERPIPDGRPAISSYPSGETEDYYNGPNDGGGGGGGGGGGEDGDRGGGFDFGDAPDPRFPSLLASNGARHRDTSVVWFGNRVSAEADARVIDNDTEDDGLLSASPLTVRLNTARNVRAGARFFVNILIDRNNNGVWEPNLGEWVVQNHIWRASRFPFIESLIFRRNVLKFNVNWKPEREGWLRMTVTEVTKEDGKLVNYNGSWLTEFRVGETEDYKTFKKPPGKPPGKPPSEPPGKPPDKPSTSTPPLTPVDKTVSAGLKPSSPLYFLDKLSEKVDLALTFNPEKKVKKALSYAQERLDEVEALMVENKLEEAKKAGALYGKNIDSAVKIIKKIKDIARAESLVTSFFDQVAHFNENIVRYEDSGHGPFVLPPCYPDPTTHSKEPCFPYKPPEPFVPLSEGDPRSEASEIDFRADKSEITLGETVTLFWKITGVVEANYGNQAQGQLGNPLNGWEVRQGAREEMPTQIGINTYFIVAKTPTGATLGKETQVKVVAPPPKDTVSPPPPPEPPVTPSKPSVSLSCDPDPLVISHYDEGLLKIKVSPESEKISSLDYERGFKNVTDDHTVVIQKNNKEIKLIAAKRHIAPDQKIEIPLVAKFERKELGEAKATCRVIVTHKQLGTPEKESSKDTEPTSVKPTIDSFASDASQIEKDQKVTLQWKTNGADKVTLNGVTVAASGSKTEKPDATTAYKLVATNKSGSVSKELTVKVVVSTEPTTQQPVIESFTSSATAVEEGQSVILRWDVAGADSVTLNGATVSASGSKTESPSTITTYTLVAKNKDGSVSKSLTVNILIPTTPAEFDGSYTTSGRTLNGSFTITGEVDVNGFELSLVGLPAPVSIDLNLNNGTGWPEDWRAEVVGTKKVFQGTTRLNRNQLQRFSVTFNETLQTNTAIDFNLLFNGNRVRFGQLDKQ